MIEQIKEYAMYKYAGDKELADSFVEGFVKAAADARGEKNFLMEGLQGALGKGLGGAAVGLALHGMNSAMGAAGRGALHTRFLESLAKAIASNPILRQANKAKVENYAETVFKFAPHVSCDSNVLSAILANAIHGEGVDVTTIKTLGDLESRYIENQGSGGFSPKAYV